MVLQVRIDYSKKKQWYVENIPKNLQHICPPGGVDSITNVKREPQGTHYVTSVCLCEAEATTQKSCARCRVYSQVILSYKVDVCG